jgi:uncharacterized integral membrane protein (TIGR00698 family)
MLFALLLGMSLNFLSQEGRCVEGIQVSATTVLRVGIALLGLRISVAQVADLGLATAGLIALSVLATIAIGIVLARACALETRFGVLTAGAVAICGASAALAIAAVLPRHAGSDRDTSFAVIGVTALSTIAMIAYPVVVGSLGFGQHDSGVFLGGTIHDVAQVVGAGYGMSKEVGDTATIVKLLRVAMLLPVVLLISLATHWRSGIDRSKTPLLPLFGVAFFALVAVNSLGWVPRAAANAAGEISRWCLVAAIAAIGMKTSLKDLSVVGMRPVLLMVLQTLALAGLVAALILVKWT